MRTIRLTFSRTFGSLCQSLVAIAASGAFLLLSGGFFVRALARGDGGSTPVAALWTLSAAPFLPILAALLTMRLVADERADGRIDLLAQDGSRHLISAGDVTHLRRTDTGY